MPEILAVSDNVKVRVSFSQPSVSSDAKEFSVKLAQPKVKIVSTVQRGLPGASAYQIAVANGYEGSPEEWLESLEGGEAVWETIQW